MDKYESLTKRKKRKTTVIAHSSSLAQELARACCHMLRRMAISPTRRSHGCPIPVPRD